MVWKKRKDLCTIVLGFCGRLAAMCAVPRTLLAMCAGLDLTAMCVGPNFFVVCVGQKREEEPCCCVHRLELVVSPSLKIIKDNSSRGHSFPPRSEPCIYGVLCVFGYLFMLMLSE